MARGDFAKTGDKARTRRTSPHGFRTAAERAAIHRSRIIPRRKAGRQIGCALGYALRGGGTGGHSARGVPSANREGKITGSDGGAIAMIRRSQSRSTFTFSGAFSGCCSCCFPAVMRLQRSHGCAPSRVVCTAVVKESARVRSMIIRVHATDCSNAQCPPMFASNARITMRRLALRRTSATGAKVANRECASTGRYRADASKSKVILRRSDARRAKVAGIAQPKNPVNLGQTFRQISSRSPSCCSRDCPASAHGCLASLGSSLRAGPPPSPTPTLRSG